MWVDLRCVWMTVRGRVLASLQPIRAEQIGWRCFCRITLLGENYTICRYGIALGGDSDARHVTSQWEAHGGSDAWCGNVWVVMRGCGAYPNMQKSNRIIFSDLYVGEGLL